MGCCHHTMPGPKGTTCNPPRKVIPSRLAKQPLPTVANHVILMIMKIETMNISLPTPLKAYVQQRVKRDGYGNISEYMRELIRGDQKKRSKERLEELLLEGMKSPSSPLTKDDWKKLRQQLNVPALPKTQSTSKSRSK